jgi:hypothetical protein
MRIGQKWIAAAMGLAATLCAATVDAGPIHGSFAIAGKFMPVLNTGTIVRDAFGNPTFNGATGINFLNLDGTDPGGAGQFFVWTTAPAEPGGVNDFAPLQYTMGSIKDFTFAGPGSAAFPTVPVLGFEGLGGGLTFDLEQIGVKYQDANTLTLAGTGYFNWAGFDRTGGFFEFSSTALGGSLAFVASEVTPVPEPASMLLLGSGALMGLRKLRRRKLAAA